MFPLPLGETPHRTAGRSWKIHRASVYLRRTKRNERVANAFTSQHEFYWLTNLSAHVHANRRSIWMTSEETIERDALKHRTRVEDAETSPSVFASPCINVDEISMLMKSSVTPHKPAKRSQEIRFSLIRPGPGKREMSQRLHIRSRDRYRRSRCVSLIPGTCP